MLAGTAGKVILNPVACNGGNALRCGVYVPAKGGGVASTDELKRCGYGAHRNISNRPRQLVTAVVLPDLLPIKPL